VTTDGSHKQPESEAARCGFSSRRGHAKPWLSSRWVVFLHRGSLSLLAAAGMLSVGWFCSLHYWNRSAQNQAKNVLIVILSLRTFSIEGNSAAALLPSAERRYLLKLLSRGRGVRGWQHHCEQRGQDKVQGKQFMKGTVAGTLTEGVARTLSEKMPEGKPGVNGDRELMMKREGSPHERKGLWEVRHQDLTFVGNWAACNPRSTWKWTLWALLQLSHAVVQSTPLPLSLAVTATLQNVYGAGSSHLPCTAAPFPWILLLWSRDYTPQGGSSRVPDSSACVYTAVNGWRTKGRGHASLLLTQKRDRGQVCCCACGFAVGTARRFTLEGSLRDQRYCMSNSEYIFAGT